MGPIINIGSHPNARIQSWVNTIAERLFLRCQLVELKDLRSIGTLAVIEQAHGARAITKQRIRGAMLDAIRREYRHASGRGEFVDVPAPARSYELKDLLQHLPENCSRLLQLRLDGYTRKEAARILEISPARARALETAGIERLQALNRSGFRRAA